MPRLAIRLRRFWREDRGNAAVEFALMMPILLLVVASAMYLLSLISLYSTLYTATYRAARYLSVEGNYVQDWGYARNQVREFIAEQVRSQHTASDTNPAYNIWLTGDNSTWQVDAILRDYYGNAGVKPSGCAGTSEDDPYQIQDVEFTVEAGIALNPRHIPIINQIYTSDEPLRLLTRHTSFLECGQTELK